MVVQICANAQGGARLFSTLKSSALAGGAGLAVALGAAGAAQADPLGMPPMSASLSANQNPLSIDTELFGPIHVTGAVTGMGYVQNHPMGADKKSRIDATSAQVFLQTTEGPVQFYIQAGAYSIPTIGVPYTKAADLTPATFDVIPQAYVKLAPTENFSIQVGKLPTLIGAEYTFSFQNLNIQRGLVWNQENAVNRGVQVNYSTGPISVSAALGDGFYSDKLSWLSGLVAFAIDDSNVLAVAAGGNLSNSGQSTSATPQIQNNQDIYNVIYTHTSGPLTLTPYFQYTKIHETPSLGIAEASSTGLALLANYNVDENWKLAGRAEYIWTKGAGTNLLYGDGSDAWSLTVTPTWQQGIFFVRGELSYVKAKDITPGLGMGRLGLDRSQTRALLETGFLF